MSDAPERIYIQATGEYSAWTWADHETDASDTEYIRADRCVPVSDPEPKSGHWTGIEMMQARYLIAAMTGRTLAEVSEPLSMLCHNLRYCFTDDEVRALTDGEEVRGMVVTDLGAWEGEDGG